MAAALLTLDRLNVCMTQAFVQTNLFQQRPPVVKENLHRPPHPHLTGNAQTLAGDVVTRVVANTAECIGTQ